MGACVILISLNQVYRNKKVVAVQESMSSSSTTSTPSFRCLIEDTVRLIKRASHQLDARGMQGVSVADMGNAEKDAMHAVDPSQVTFTTTGIEARGYWDSGSVLAGTDISLPSGVSEY